MLTFNFQLLGLTEEPNLEDKDTVLSGGSPSSLGRACAHMAELFPFFPALLRYNRHAALFKVYNVTV